MSKKITAEDVAKSMERTIQMSYDMGKILLPIIEEKMKSKPLKCKEKNCKGIVNLDEKVPLQIGCCSFDMAHPCSDCGRLHWHRKGKVYGVKNRQNKKSFFIGGQLQYK